MASASFLVIRLVPDSPVDSGTFGTYLDGLSIKVYKADAPQIPANLLGQVPPTGALQYAPVQLIQVSFLTTVYVAGVPKLVVDNTQPVAPNDYGNKLTLDSLDGIAFGSTVGSPSNSSLFNGGTTVTDLTGAVTTLNQEIPNQVAAGSVVTFYYQYGPGILTIAADYSSFSLTVKTAQSASSKTVVKMASTNGIAVGMAVSAASGVLAGTAVLGVSSTQVTFSNAVTVSNNMNVTFTCELNTGIVQHVGEKIEWDGLEPYVVPTLQSVATAIVPMPSEPADTYVDIALAVTRNDIAIPVNNEFYNVLVQVQTSLPAPNQYQGISLQQTCLYLSLPAPPVNDGALSLLLPTDGTAPAYDQLLPVIKQAAQYDPYFAGVDLTALTTDQCTRMAYDIVWSQQNQLPLPPDVLEDLYTNPPNPGSADSGGNSNADEQDRQKWEGTLNSFYSTRNATAVRLAKFVAAVSGALYCEQRSTAAVQALLEFPVDPKAYADASPIESEVLVTGLNAAINFGVPAAFFYALGTNRGTPTTGDDRYNTAVGDTVPRLMQEFTQAAVTRVINDQETFSLPLGGPPTPLISVAQAARRLSALAVTSNSTTPMVHLPATTQFNNLVVAWLAATSNPTTPSPNPQPPSYRIYKAGDDMLIWAMLAGVVPSASAPQYSVQAQPTEAGYLYLVLIALTRGYIAPGTSESLASKIIDWLPSTTSPATLNPTVDTVKGVTAAQWTSFFTTGPADPSWLPPFTQPGNNLAPSQSPLQPGYVTIQIKAFIRAVQQFFSVSSVPNPAATINPEAPATYDLPDFDAIGQAAANLGAGFTFGAGPLTDAQISSAIQGIFPPGEAARRQKWLERSIATINELARIAKAVPQITPNASPVPGNIDFSIMEALYARGFTSARDITRLTQTEFQQHLIGTIAYGDAAQLYSAAQAIAPFTPSTGNQSQETFVPINPDGSLTDCIPPLAISPLGPSAYLQAMLRLHENATCATVMEAEASDSPTLATAIAGRRGPLGDLLTTRANIEVPLPLIDIVNENLENVATGASFGAVYSTATTTLSGYALCAEAPEAPSETSCHSAQELLGTMPQWSSPAVPVAQPSAYTKLAQDFSSPCLPYLQSLDISRSYQRLLCECRADTMRAFRKDITEFVLAPDARPSGFDDSRWRYPVRFEIALEYLRISQEEAATLFTGGGKLPESVPLWQIYGFASADSDRSWTQTVLQLSQFLERTGISYCEFRELQTISPVPITNGSTQDGKFPDCEPCCLDGISLSFGNADTQSALMQLAVFIRLWRALKRCCGGFTFAELADIVAVLGPLSGGAYTRDFMRQLAALQMLREHLGLPLSDRADQIPASASGPDRTQLLALWSGPSAAKWNWAVRELLERVSHTAKRLHEVEGRPPEFIKILADNLDSLSRLAGFNPDVATDTWHSRPACTLRFAEILAKIYASNFSLGDLLFMVTAAPHLDGEDAFPLQDVNDALDSPLDLPEGEAAHSLHALRWKLLAAKVPEDAGRAWTWDRITTSLQRDFGYVPDGAPGLPDSLLSFGKHFFSNQLAASGIAVSASDRRYTFGAPVATSALMWNVPGNGPFRCDPDGGSGTVTMWSELPLRDDAVIEKLTHVRTLSVQEQEAVQDLYFQPRAQLAPLAFLFPDFESAAECLIQERDEGKRWEYFTHHFALTHERCRLIAEHLGANVAHVVGGEGADHTHTAWLVLRSLLADENGPSNPSDWQNSNGMLPAVMWNPLPNGSAFAALLGLAGTGLSGEISTLDGQLLWREMRGPFDAFGELRSMANAPVPTILPQFDYAPPAADVELVSVHNGFAARDRDGVNLGGAQGYMARWTGALLIDREGRYEFDASVPHAEHNEHETLEDTRSWRVILKRGQKTWLLLKNRWAGAEGEPAVALNLKRGAYQLVIELRQETPDFSRPEWLKHQRTGLRLTYCGPDSEDEWIAIPRSRLYREKKVGPLSLGIEFKSERTLASKTFLETLYTSSLRDIRRTYQRAFKALLFAQRLNLASKAASDDGQSELGYMLAHGSLFAGIGFARNAGSFTSSQVNFDFNFLPLRDDYLSPTATEDPRTQPSSDRIAALFDIWERLFDYAQVRRQVRQWRDREAWLLFDEALNKRPAHVGFLLRHLGIDSRHNNLLLTYYQGPAPGTLYGVTAADLETDLWMVRIWHGEQWTRKLLKCFCPREIAFAMPALWAADDPSVLVSGQTVTGNQNLVQFVDDGYWGGEKPWRYSEVRRVNEGLRERAREALVAYLCHGNRVSLPWSGGKFAQAPLDLSAYLLIDVEVGLCQTASRMEEAITAVQTFVRRARLGLEPGWKVSREFAMLWDRQFASFHIWKMCRERELYRENWEEWNAIEKAQRIEAFRFLEAQLKVSSLSIAEAGGGEWWPDERPAPHAGILPLQVAVPSTLTLLPSSAPAPEGFTLLGTPENSNRTTWLSAPAAEALTAPPSSTPIPGRPGNGQPSGQQPDGTPSSGGAKPRIAALASNAAAQQATQPANLPYWLESAMRLGKQFVRVAAACKQSASSGVDGTWTNHGGCCTECGAIHASVVDEYYFWLFECEQYVRPDQAFGVPSSTPAGSYQFGIQDPYYDETQQQSVQWNNGDDKTALAKLLHWPANPAVRLAWCRVHNGEFGAERRSTGSVLINSSATLQFLGRAVDSLYFSTASGAATNPPPGFRFDLPSDEAYVLPMAVPPPVSTSSLPGQLTSYPFFAFDTPGATLYPSSVFAPAVLVAAALRNRCRYDLALKWYELAFAPLQSDCSWIDCDQQKGDQGSGPAGPAGGSSQQPTNQPAPRGETSTGTNVPANAESKDNSAQSQQAGAGQPSTENGACCDSTNVSVDAVRNRALTLHYCETLLEWGHHLMRRRNSPESFQQARLLFDTAAGILGRPPRKVLLPEPSVPQTVTDFKPAIPALNPRLLELYDHTADRLDLVRNCLNSARLYNGKPGKDTPYFGDDPLRLGWRSAFDSCVDEAEWCLPHNPYRFQFLIQKALDFATGLRELGGQLLSAVEKGDAECLGAIRAEHENEMAALQIAIRQEQWRDADWQIQALQQTKDLNQTNLIYYTELYQNDLINDEIQYQSLTTTATQTRTSANMIEAEGEFMKVIPDLFIGFPCTDSQVPIGTKLAGVFETIGKVISIFADIQSATAALDLTLAGWQRRSEEWLHQTQTLPIEIQQAEMQILGAQRRRAQALLELNNQQRQTEQSTAVLNYLRDKFSSDKLYLWMQKEAFGLYHKMYELALHTARQAERAFNFERGHTTRRFLPGEAWDDLHDGLLAGERLEVCLRRMEKAYLDENIREHELTKNISLRQMFPGEYLRLRTTGYCEIDIPEWMFDLDYPGHYMRRLRNVRLRGPVVTGPYTGFHCTLTLLSSSTRVDPSLRVPPHPCCHDHSGQNVYDACWNDPRVVRQHAARESIATSTGQDDSGMFEVNFRDDRYLPFEYFGAVSHWRIELPPENNYFDLDTLTDLILTLNYTSRSGGPLLREAARDAARDCLPGNGWGFFDVRRDFPDAWSVFTAERRSESPKELSLQVRRNLFPYLPGRPEVAVSEMMFVFDVGTDCRHDCIQGHFHVSEDGRVEDRAPIDDIRFVPHSKWRDMYHGAVHTHLEIQEGKGEHRRVHLRFPDCAEHIHNVFLFCRYEAGRPEEMEVNPCCRPGERPPQRL